MMKMESRKSRPRWWDNFFGPKNSSSIWVQENLEEMNQNVRRMLELIEDSYAKRVKMYYESRQELINLVGKCYRLYCSLAERYNHATGELLNSIPNSDLIRSQGRDNGITISNVSSGKSSTYPLRLHLTLALHSNQETGESYMPLLSYHHLLLYLNSLALSR